MAQQSNRELKSVHAELAALRAERDRLLSAVGEAMRTLDHPPGVSFEEVCRRNTEAWRTLQLVLKPAALSPAKEGA